MVQCIPEPHVPAAGAAPGGEYALLQRPPVLGLPRQGAGAWVLLVPGVAGSLSMQHAIGPP